MAYLATSSGIAFIIGPPLGGILWKHMGSKSPAFLAGILYFIDILLTYFQLPEAKQVQNIQGFEKRNQVPSNQTSEKETNEKETNEKESNETEEVNQTEEKLLEGKENKDKTEQKAKSNEEDITNEEIETGTESFKRKSFFSSLSTVFSDPFVGSMMFIFFVFQFSTMIFKNNFYLYTQRKFLLTPEQVKPIFICLILGSDQHPIAIVTCF